MKIAVIANARVAVRAMDGIGPAFVTAFKAGCVMGFCLVGMALLNLFVAINLFKLHFSGYPGEHKDLYAAISAYGLGGSSIALFGRVGGGIFTKAADVGADLVGKVEQNIPEDDPRNPAVIADCVGDNVGDIAGMGADLFGSFAEGTCAVLVIASTNKDLALSWSAMMFPLVIMATGVLVCLLTSFFATHFMVVSDVSEIEPSLKRQIMISTLLMTPTIFICCLCFLPSSLKLLFVDGTTKTIQYWHIFFCVASGLWSGMIIGYTTEYYTSNAYGPVKDVASSSRTGAATLIIYGLALGYKSVIIPIVCLCVTIFVGFHLADVYGVAIAALGILSTLPTGLTIDAYGPISDNAGGIAEMSGMGKEVRSRTDALDAAGNTTAAIGKGFAIGSAALVSLALFAAFVKSSHKRDPACPKGLDCLNINILDPFTFAGLLFGAMLPYWFSAMTMKSVGKAAMAMVEEVREQFRSIKGLMEGTATPNYRRCVKISTDASLREMLPPGALVMATPLLTGFLFGVQALSGLLVGSLISSVQMAISSSNSGGAWDNSKKLIEAGAHGGKGSDCHKAAVIGDTVGDPLKDTSGPSLNILLKLAAIISLVFAPAIKNHGGLIARYL
jgi:H(+)-translocating pyrophosphatase